MPPVVADARFDLGDGVVHQAEGSGAMAAFVRVGMLELGLRRTQVLECCVHAGLVRRGVAGDEARCKSEEENEGG